MYPTNPMNPMIILGLANCEELRALQQQIRDNQTECETDASPHKAKSRKPFLARIFGRARRQPACEAC